MPTACRLSQTLYGLRGNDLGRPRHRGAEADRAEFARRFLLGRLLAFEKDVRICLTPLHLEGASTPTHAYFPALAACCGTLEYLSAFLRGRTHGLGWPDVSNWAGRFLPQPDYDEETIRVLIEAFRHAVAHRGIASGVWVDRRPGMNRRLTWRVTAARTRPSVALVPEAGALTLDSPWPCLYTHRVHIHLKAMAVDIREGAKHHAESFANDTQLVTHFFQCMRQLYPN